MSALSERLGESTSSHEHVSKEYQDALELWDEVEPESLKELDKYPVSDEVMSLIELLKSL